MANFDQKVSDWQVKAYLDIGAGALIAAYGCHLRVYSPTLKIGVHGLFGGLGVGIGAGVDAHGIVQALDKGGGLTDMLPSAGQDMKTMVLKPFCIRDLMSCPASVFTAGVAAIAAPADAKVIQLGTMIQAVEAKVTVKLAVEVQASWTFGVFIPFYPNLYESYSVTQERKYRKKASDPLYLSGNMK
jgi:hypothetical protein